MSIATEDLGVLNNLAVALGVFTTDGQPNSSWFGDPEASLRTILEDNDQRAALIAFVDEAMGGADRTTDPSGVVWLPIIQLEEPALTFAITVDEAPADGIHIGLGVLMRTTAPASTSSIAIPLFLSKKENGPEVSNVLLLGQPGGHIRLATAITIDEDAPVPGEARLGAIGIDVDVPTTIAAGEEPVFGLALTSFQLPGAASPRDIRVAADGLNALDDAVLDLVLALVKSQADAAAAGSSIIPVAGLLGLKDGDDIPDFPIKQLPVQGPQAIAGWLHGVMTTSASREDWLDYLADLIGVTRTGDDIVFTLGGGARLTIGLRVDTGPSGNARLTPVLGVHLGDHAARIEARADLVQIDLVTGAAQALPQFGVWAAAGDAGHPLLDVTATQAHADTLRVGFQLDPLRRLTFVLAGDGVTLGSQHYASLDLTSPDAVMDAAAATVEDVANELLAGLGDALDIVQLLLGLEPPAGVTAVSLVDLVSDPVAAVGAYYRRLAAAPTAMQSVLAAIRDALADSSALALPITGTGAPLTPWRVPLIGPLQLEVSVDGDRLAVGVAGATSVDNLGQGGIVVDTRLAARLAEIDLAQRTGSLFPGVEASLAARQAGAGLPRIQLDLGEDAALSAGGVGLRLEWTPANGLSAGLQTPDLTLQINQVDLPLSLPVVAADGSVSLPPEAWDGVEALVGYLGALSGGFLADVVAVLDWRPDDLVPGEIPLEGTRLRLADLVADPQAALGEWLPRLMLSDVGPLALSLVADLFTGSGPLRAVVEGTGHPDDPYRLPLADGLPNLAVWFPPQGLEQRLVAAPEELQRWRPGDPGFPPEALAACLLEEARVARDVAELIEGRSLEAGLAELALRWVGGDGRIVPPPADPPGVVIERVALGAGQLLAFADLEMLTGRLPTTAVFVALGAQAWPDAPAGRRVDLSTPGLSADMFSLPAAATGEWFVALGSRADSRPAAAGGDGTAGQATRLGRFLETLAPVSSDITLVAVAGAGHAARLAAQAQDRVTHLVTLGTPLSPISLTALNTQPTADALRLLHRLLPAPLEAGSGDPGTEIDDLADDEDLALGRALVGAMMELVDQADPSADLRPPDVAPEAPRSGLTVIAVFGEVDESRVSAAMTAIIAAGLAERAQLRAAEPLPDPTGVHAGLRLALPPTTSGTLAVSGDAVLTLFAYDVPAEAGAGDSSASADTRRLRMRLRVADRLGWLVATPDMELRMLTADVDLPVDAAAAAAPGHATVTLHDGRVFGQSWERLVLGSGAGSVPVLPEARLLLSAAVQRITTDADGSASLALADLLAALGLIAPGGGVVGDAVDQLVHDPSGLVRQRLAAAGPQLSTALAALLGPTGTTIDLPGRRLQFEGGSDASGRFGWQVDLAVDPGGMTGQVRFGPSVEAQAAGGLNVIVDLAGPLQVRLDWRQPGGALESAALWPAPAPEPLGRMLAQAAPSLVAHAALEVLRRADETVRPTVDALLDALGLLSGAPDDAERALRPLAGLLADPAGWLRSPSSLAASPARIQALFDALRPLMGLPGAAGTPLVLANGVALSAAADGSGARLALEIDPTLWAAPGGATGRLSAGLGASLRVAPSGAPGLGLELHAGLPGAPAGRQAVYARLSESGVQLFLRPLSGSDIGLVPFGGLGALSAVAEMALPFLLDELAGLANPVGDVVQVTGDALGLRSGTPPRFDAAAIHAWGVDPVSSLQAAAPNIIATGLTNLVPCLEGFVPAGITVGTDGSRLTLTRSDVSLSWNPLDGAVTLSGEGVSVPGTDQLTFTLTLSGDGLEELSATAGPAQINAGGVMLRPFMTVSGGLNPANGRQVALGMALNETQRFAARWVLEPPSFALVASDGPLTGPSESEAPGAVAGRLVEIIADLVAAVAIQQAAVQALLNTKVGQVAGEDRTVRHLLEGVVLRPAPDSDQLIEGLFEPDSLLERLLRLFGNIAGAGISITVDQLTLAFKRSPANIIGLEVGLSDRFELLSGDVMLWLENDAAWITGAGGDGGVFVGFLPDTEPLRFTPSLSINGVGLRIGKSAGPLLEAGISLESIALHAFAGIDDTGVTGGGVQLEFTNLAVAASGAGGSNGIAQGILRDTGPTPPQPAFSPALAVQQHGSGPVQVTLRAGEGDGPWWIAIQRGFGPLYLEQIGFGVVNPQGRLERISLLMDGSVSMFGLTCAVDDLQITYLVADGDFFNYNNWKVDLAGLAVSANLAGVSIAGGLLKQVNGTTIEYLGMLLGRFGVYGLTIYGGYGEGEQDGQRFTAFFAVGAVNGPLGGPPAFFLTGIGGGFGINRQLVVPSDLARFGEYPLIQALDIAAQPQEPMAQLRALAVYFPMQRGTFWFAAGLSFNSFALVDGIAVVAVQIGDGLDINLLGLARMALPRPQAALVSIELALLVRFSSTEGVLWVQGQLTDNSWLLYEEVKLTGGFAYVIWFKGEHRGEFVLTLGGYHPEFHRDGYPVVPRLGLRWSIGDSIVIKAGSYFALTSEALMAGGDFEVSADFGPAWAEVKFGAHGIIYFDPFRYQVEVYARIAAGVTIDTWLFGEITISVSLGARIKVSGPEFHGIATFEVGPIELTVEFGGPDRSLTAPLSAGEFIDKYLEPGEGGALAHAVITAFGALPAKSEDSTPDGSAARPFIVVVEFGLTFTSTVPADTVVRTQGGAQATTTHDPSRSLGVAPMKAGSLHPTITLTWRRFSEGIPVDQPFPFVARARSFGSFPVGVWGPPQDDNNRKVPKAEMIEALNELDLEASGAISAPGPEIPYYQVEIGERKPLPFARQAAQVSQVKSQAAEVEGLVSGPATVAQAFAAARTFLQGSATPTQLAALRGERQAPPLLGTLTEGLQADPATAVPEVLVPPPGKVYDHFVDPPVAVGMLTGATLDIRASAPLRTTVRGSEAAWRTAPPTLASVEAGRSRSIPTRLALIEPQAVSTGRAGTMIGSVAVPPSAIAHAAPAIVARVGAAGTEPLNAFSQGLLGSGRDVDGAGASLSPGQLVVLKLPNARADAARTGERPRLGVSGLPARLVLLGHGGRLLADRLLGDPLSPGGAGASLEVPQGVERIIAMSVGRLPGGEDRAGAAGLLGWHAGMQLPYVGWSSAIAPGCVVRSSGEPIALHRERVEAGWIGGAELARGVSTVATTFSEPVTTVVVILDDPAAFGDPVAGRQLLLGLDGARRVRQPDGSESPPVLLAMENRSVLAYDVVPDGDRPMVVTIASELGWSLVGVMGAPMGAPAGSAGGTATGAIALIAARGLDAAVRPFAAAASTPETTHLEWQGPTRTPGQRRQARALASGRPPAPAELALKASRQKRGAR